MKRLRKLKLRHFLLVSLGLHLFAALFVFVSSLSSPPQSLEPVQLEIVEATPVEVAPDKVKKALKIEKNQIVDQAKEAYNDETPEDARFLSQNNQVVKRQTVSQNRGEFQNKHTKETTQGKNGQQKSLSKVDLRPKFDIAKAIQDRIQREQDFEKAANDGFRTQPIAAQNQVKPNQEGQGAPLAKGGDTSQTLDYIKDLDPGLETLLTTKEFVYYTYFNRIRNQLNQHWTDMVRDKLSEMYKKGRSLASSDDKVTKCLITLDPGGKLLRVQIIGDSGVRELDEAAVEAFKAAAPFPNPPKGMVDSDGTIKIRWDFILEA